MRRALVPKKAMSCWPFKFNSCIKLFGFAAQSYIVQVSDTTGDGQSANSPFTLQKLPGRERSSPKTHDYVLFGHYHRIDYMNNSVL